MKDLLYASLGLVVLTKEKVEEIVSDLVKKGEMSNEEGKKALDTALSKMQEETVKLKTKIQEQVESTLSTMNVAKASEMAGLLMRIEKLEKRIDEIDKGDS